MRAAVVESPRRGHARESPDAEVGSNAKAASVFP